MNRLNFTVPKTLIALLLCAMAGVSFANPGWGREKGYERDHSAEHSRDQRRNAKQMRREEMRAQRIAQRNRQQPQQVPAPVGDKPKRQVYAYDAPPAANNGNALPPNNGKMTPEERRALRRQINEANQTIPHRNYP